jgi:hypothetical protein
MEKQAQKSPGPPERTVPITMPHLCLCVYLNNTQTARHGLWSTAVKYSVNHYGIA